MRLTVRLPIQSDILLDELEAALNAEHARSGQLIIVQAADVPSKVSFIDVTVGSFDQLGSVLAEYFENETDESLREQVFSIIATLDLEI